MRALRAVPTARALAACAVGVGTPASAQSADPSGHAAHDSARGALHDTAGAHAHRSAGGHARWLRVQGIGMVTRVDPAVGGQTLVEGYLTQPVVMAHGAVAGGRVRLAATLNLEGVTLRRGQLNAGAYGEGYVDRRHPHTFVHEAMAAVVGAVPGVRGARASLAAGRGFVAFGTDDPMNRPFTLFPVNHHLAQILERVVAVGALRVDRGVGGASLEASVFNGDEPAGPGSRPRLARVGDSWAARATLVPRLGGARAGALELSGSAARVASPEDPAGGGLDQRKSSLAARWSRGTIVPGAPGDSADALYAMVEWARTDEHRGARRAFRYQSVLAEGALRRRGASLAARAERTARPEEERLVDPFRTVQPHFEGNVLGVTEWRVLTVAASARLPLRGAGALAAAAVPFVEVARQSPREVIRPSTFEPPLFYGARTLWTLSAGVRLGAGVGHARMGRYGVVGEGH